MTWSVTDRKFTLAVFECLSGEAQAKSNGGVRVSWLPPNSKDTRQLDFMIT